jgi:hypothetical protein
VQRIPLIERVNRRVSPELQEFTLARIGGANRQQGDVKVIREYQLTMRNTSPMHLRDAEVQFEFPADDVEAWVERPKLSKTPLEVVGAAAVKAPWKKAFRWKIPHLPSGDSVEFTFRAVNPITGLYEAALYGIEGVVLNKMADEPPLRIEGISGLDVGWVLAAAVALGAFLTLFGHWAFTSPPRAQPATLSITDKPKPPEIHTRIKLAGCNLQVTSSADLMRDGTWHRGIDIINLGAQGCEIQSDKMGLVKPEIVDAGRERGAGSGFSEGEPKLVDAEISVHTTDTSSATTIAQVYVAP